MPADTGIFGRTDEPAHSGHVCHRKGSICSGCGWTYIFLGIWCSSSEVSITASRNALTFGWPQLGVGALADQSLVPKLIPSLSNITTLACGWTFTFAQSGNGTVYGALSEKTSPLVSNLTFAALVFRLGRQHIRPAWEEWNSHRQLLETHSD
jgi:hypothetical protein